MMFTFARDLNKDFFAPDRSHYRQPGIVRLLARLLRPVVLEIVRDEIGRVDQRISSLDDSIKRRAPATLLAQAKRGGKLAATSAGHPQ